MKIDNDINAREAAGVYRANKPSNNTGGPSFSDILSQAVDGTTRAQAAQSTQAASPTASSAATTQPAVWEGTNDLVDSLDQYGAALANPAMSLKQLEPMTNRLEQQAEELAGSLSQDSGDSLQGLAWQAVSQARAEVLKFRRGDYI